jgi:hypothetical protein
MKERKRGRLGKVKFEGEDEEGWDSLFPWDVVRARKIYYAYCVTHPFSRLVETGEIYM